VKQEFPWREIEGTGKGEFNMADADWTENDEQTYWSITHPTYPEFKARPAYWGLDYGAWVAQKVIFQ